MSAQSRLIRLWGMIRSLPRAGALKINDSLELVPYALTTQMLSNMKVWIAGAVLLVGCSDKPDPAVSAGGAAGATADSNGGSAGAGATNSGGVAGSVESARAGMGGSTPTETWIATAISLPLTLRGQMDVSQMSADDASFTYELYAQFGMLRGQWDGCTRHQLGECWYYECPEGSAPVGTSNVGTLRSVGDVLVSSSTVNYSLRYDAKMTYSTADTGAFWPLTGGVVTFTTSNPKLTIAVATPPSVWLSTLNGQAAPASIKRSEGAKLSWRVRGTGIAFFSIYRLDGTIPAAVCTFDATRGEGTLPPDVLQKLDAGTDYKFAFRGDARANATLEGYELDAALFAFGSASPLATKVTLE